MNKQDFSPTQFNISEDDWQQTPESVKAVVKLMPQLQARLAKIEEQLKLSSENSSKPPSSDQLPHKREKKGKRPRGKKRGGQVGHPGHYRKRMPLEDVSECRVYKPEQCEHCGEALNGEDANPYRWQVTEIPPIESIVIEHQVHRLCCETCGKASRGHLPSDVAHSQFGERLSALVGVLIGQYRLSKRQVVRMMRDVFGVEIALGSVVNRQQELSNSLEKPMKEVEKQIQQAPSRNIDETGWREGNNRSYLWSVVSSEATIFRIVASRGSQVAEDLLGKTSTGITTSDRFTAYNFLRGKRHQTCWAHLLRHFKRLELRETESATIGAMLVMYSEYLLHRYRRVRDGTLTRHAFLVEVPQHQQDIRTWLERGTQVDHPKTSGFCRGLLKHFDMLWTFTQHQHIEPTNNAVEQALRHGVIWRKLCYGTDSIEGSRFVERILTVIATCRQQSKPLLDFLYLSLVAHRHERDAPLLLTINP